MRVSKRVGTEGVLLIGSRHAESNSIVGKRPPLEGLTSSPHVSTLTANPVGGLAMSRYCRECGVELVPSGNWPLSREKYGHYICRRCVNAQSKAYRKTHKAQAAATMRRWRRAHKGYYARYQKYWWKTNQTRKAAYNKAYQEKHRVEIAAYRKCYRAANSDRMRTNKKRWQRANPDKVKAMNYRANLRRRARIAHVPFERVDREVIFQADAYHCVYCGSTEKLTIDHIVPLAKGGAHIEENLVIACRSCNGSKGTKTLVVWLAQRR